MRNALVLAALAVTAIAGPCKPTGSSTELLSTTIRSTESSYVKSSVVNEETSSAAVTESTDVVTSIASSDATTTAEATTTSGSESTTTAPPDDSCAESLYDMNGEPEFTDRIADCQELNVVTVSSYEVTMTVYKRGNVIIIPTNAIVRRAEGEAATTIFPTDIPAYATYCNNPSAYYEACSQFGVTAFTTTIPEPTTTEVIITN
ncbi:uncharacterized protein FTJAE_7578 [Fusarium tjaetaba]|uniref:Uncharacterized protein n=1 Tax=Fusarium tjaetaba TaxID=1567544 RepID=A0A8H5RCL5_9HYPO|nr:uncharacterized protein FTJAE_7578 [Fusarium tjaetaba]KAF5632246.1 hypothetical protein FTJAE_7578 [Fusarium tjaetaba]